MVMGDGGRTIRDSHRDAKRHPFSTPAREGKDGTWRCMDGTCNCKVCGKLGVVKILEHPVRIVSDGQG